MGDKTGIEWTDATWNPVTGCTKVSQGCKHCYAERVFPRVYSGAQIDTGLERNNDYLGPVMRPRKFTDVQCHQDRLDQPLRWRRARRIFVNSMSDLFHEDVPDQFITDVFGIMALAHWHTFQVLTKRPNRMLEYLCKGDHGIIAQFSAIQRVGGISIKPVFAALDVKRRDEIDWAWPLRNVWLGVSVENQETADERIPLLLHTPAAVRFLSCEPLLGRVDLTKIDLGWCSTNTLIKAEDMTAIDWVIAGGESGPHARPMHPAWVRSLRDQCHSAGVPFLFKQWGEWLGDLQDGNPNDPKGQELNASGGPLRVGKKAAGRLLDGREHSEYPR